jgi:hypothetical protein
MCGAFFIGLPVAFLPATKNPQQHIRELERHCEAIEKP